MPDMSSSDQNPDINTLEASLKLMSEKFDHAIKKNVELGELQQIFHEMKSLKIQLENLKGNIAEVSQNPVKNK
jgi:hypothetical protein